MNRNIFLFFSICLLCTSCGKPTILPDAKDYSETAEFSDTLQDSEAETISETETFPKPEEISSEETSAEPEEEYPEEMISLIDDIIIPSMSEYEKVKAIHDYLVIHVNYDYENLAADTLPPDAFTAKGALMDHLAVCEGYAKAFSFLCSRTGLEETLIYGTATDENGEQYHAWNQVKVDGVWYNIDVTWDDPLMNGEAVTDGSNIIYDYFLVPDSVLEQNHVPNRSDNIQSCTSSLYLEENRRLSILPYLEDPYCFTSSDTESQEAVTQYLADQVYKFQIVADVTYQDPETKMNLIVEQVKTAMEFLGLYGQISANVQYGIADYAVITITITPQ